MERAPWRWQTHVFSGVTVDEATAALQMWLGTDTWEIVKQPIIRLSADGPLLMYLSHCPMVDGHRIYVTALMEVREDDGSSAAVER